jgi:hypothetical protein
VIYISTCLVPCLNTVRSRVSGPRRNLLKPVSIQIFDALCAKKRTVEYAYTQGNDSLTLRSEDVEPNITGWRFTRAQKLGAGAFIAVLFPVLKYNGITILRPIMIELAVFCFVRNLHSRKLSVRSTVFGLLGVEVSEGAAYILLSSPSSSGRSLWLGATFQTPQTRPNLQR